MAKTLFDKIWDGHVIADLGNGFVLLHIDRLLLHDMSGGKALKEAIETGHVPAQPRLIYGTPDHTMSTRPGRTAKTFPPGEPLIQSMRETTSQYGIKLFDLGQDGNGIVHVIGPEQGLTLPGTTLVCGDSHTSTHGGMGALAFGIGASELVHVIATQTMVQRKPKLLRASFEGKLEPGVTAKDMILHLIGELGTAAGTGYAVEYAGLRRARPACRGAAHAVQPHHRDGRAHRHGGARRHDLRIPAGRDYAPKGAMWDRAVAHWRTLPSDPDADFDREHTIDMAKVAPQITWGTSPEHVIAVDRADPRSDEGPETSARPGRRRCSTRVSSPASRSRAPRSTGCSSARAPTAASPTCAPPPRSPGAATRRDHVTAWVVPGSERVKREAEAEGLDTMFTRRRLRMARARLLDVHRLQRRARAAGPAQRLDLQPQLRRPPGPRRAHPSRQPGDGGGRRAIRTLGRHRRLCRKLYGRRPTMEKFTKVDRRRGAR